jgi:pseudaminic acid cytidylyltransferase
MPESPVVAVIPARGGSKRIPRKNIRPFLGVPLIARTIARLQDAACFDRIVVSTDDDEIAALSCAAGAEAPFRRDASLAGDHASTVPVIRDAIEQLEHLGIRPTTVVAVYPAAVFVTTADLHHALALLQRPQTDYVVPVTSFPYPIQRALRWRDDGSTELFQPEHYESRSQDLEPAYHDVGQFYAGTRQAWLEERALFTARTKLLRIPRARVQDIDTQEDWERAEALFQLLEGADGASPTSTSALQTQ